MWYRIEEMGAQNVTNVRGWSVTRRMTNIVGVDFVHDSVRSSKLRVTTRVGTIDFGVGINV